MFAGFTHAIADRAARLPVLRPWLRRMHWRSFCAASGPVRRFHGIYADFPSAERALAAGRLTGYDNEASAQRLAGDRLRICSFDYPVMFWLQKLLPSSHLLFDLGGHVGISYYGYRDYLDYPPTLQWMVCDLPAITALGQTIAAREATSALSFTNSLDALPAADILLAAGSLQFIAEPFELLKSARGLPRHVLLNKVPLHDGAAAVTLHNFGAAMCAYHLFNRGDFLAGFAALGYRLVDEWLAPDLGCEIRLFPQYSIRAYTGCYFVKRD